jgi:hypothetical protein
MSEQSEGAIADDIGRSSPASPVTAEAALGTVRLNSTHRTDNFSCSRSARVTGFLREQALDRAEHRYCGVFILEDPDDPAHILGYYTLSPFILSRDAMSSSHRSKQVMANVPLALIGFMGKQDGTDKGIGALLVSDAARRAYRNLDMPTRGLAVQPEDGKENAKLWSWYESMRFCAAKSIPGVMYGPYENFMPELKKMSRG